MDAINNLLPRAGDRPHIKYKMSMITKIVLVLLVGFVLFVIGAALLG